MMALHLRSLDVCACYKRGKDWAITTKRHILCCYVVKSGQLIGKHYFVQAINLRMWSQSSGNS